MVKSFVYQKSADTGPREVQVYPLKVTDDAIEGIDINRLDPKDQAMFLTLVEEFQDQLTYFVQKGYRRFLTSKIKGSITDGLQT